MWAMDRDGVSQWVARYELAWRTPGTEVLPALFTPDVTYLASPWAPAIRGLDEVARFWEAERAGPDEPFTMTSDIVALDDVHAVVRVMVDYGGDQPTRWRDLWVMRFAADGRCQVFEEWPFAADQPDGHGR